MHVVVTTLLTIVLPDWGIIVSAARLLCINQFYEHHDKKASGKVKLLSLCVQAHHAAEGKMLKWWW